MLQKELRLQGVNAAMLQKELRLQDVNAAFFRSCALSGEIPEEGSEPYPVKK